jgi:hypothetical protein
MKAFGWILTIVCALIIIYNVATTKENERMIKDHPFITILSGGENLKPAYTFLPPYSGFEITVIAAGVIGIVIIINAKE